MSLNAIVLFIHIVSVMVWMGGMFFAYACLRPATAELPPEQRLALWRGTLGRFLNWVGVAIVLILLTGGMMFARMGAAHAPWQIHAMAALGVVMMLVFGHVRFALYRRLQRHVSAGAWSDAGKAMNGIRQGVVLNLVIGVVIIALAATLRA